MSKLKYVRDKLLRKPSILSGNKSEQQVSKQRRSNSTYLASTSSSMANNLNVTNNNNLTNSNYANSNLMAMASSASSEFSLAAINGGMAAARTPGACSIQSSVSFRHHVEPRAGAGGGNKKPRIVSAIAQQQTLNEDEEV